MNTAASIYLGSLDRMELEWLGRQRQPMWGGHLERGEPITSPSLQRWVDEGIVQAVTSPRVGYVLTTSGRQQLRS